MKRIALALMFFVSPVFAQQQPTPAEIVDALSMKVLMLQQQLDQMYLALARQKVEADEKTKWILDNWVK